MNLLAGQNNTPDPRRQPTQDLTPPAGTNFNDGDHSSEDDSDQDERHRTQAESAKSMSLSTRVAVDLYDKLPPELLEHILMLVPHSTLFCCTTLSKRWARIVIPHLWHTPWMMYYVSWMKLLQTISYTTLSSSTSSSSSGLLIKGLKDPTHKQNCPAYSRALANGSGNNDNNYNTDDTTRDTVLAWDNFSDHEDEDPSGLLRLAENQRRES
ncbi:hypothetical protein BG003_008853, partial [Podila horticola]